MNDYKIPLHPHWIPFNDGQIPILNVESPIHQFSIYPHVDGQSPSLPPLREGRAREGPQTWRCRPAWAAPLRVSRTPGRWNSATFRASPIHEDSICHMYLGIMWADIYIYIHTGWWYTYPSEKWWTSSVGMMKFPIYGKIKNVPNHQPVYLIGYMVIHGK